MKNIKTIVTVIVTSFTLLITSCEKETLTSGNERSGMKVEFQQRQLLGTGIIPSSPAGLEAVDLGLSVKWSNMNLGANTPVGDGDLYAWGTIYPFGSFSWEGYEMNDFHPEERNRLYITRYCFDLRGEKQDLDMGGVNLDPNDDAANLFWGEGWRMPTCNELQELFECCEWTYSHAMHLFIVKGPNGNVIRIAYPGVGYEGDVYDIAPGAVSGGLWSSTLSAKQSDKAVMLQVNVSANGLYGLSMMENDRCIGGVIRPVISAE